MAYFPMCIELDGRRCLVVGGGAVALRKIRALVDFGADVVVAADEVREEIRTLPGVRVAPGGWEDVFSQGKWALAVAATNDREVNRSVGICCRSRGIPVNVADDETESTFIFPAYIRQGSVVAAFTGGGGSPAVAQYLKRRSETVLTELVGELAGELAAIREEAVRTVPQEARKAFYEELLAVSLAAGRVPTKEEERQLLFRYSEREV